MNATAVSDMYLEFDHARPVPGLRRGARFAGFVETVENDRIQGWAVDRAFLDRHVVVECWCDGRVVASARADLPRHDLRALGLGDGRYGFSIWLPEDVTDRQDVVLRASVKDSPLSLTYQGAADFVLPTVPYLWFVAADIVNNCNLRCPFCLVDYSAVTKTELMTEETFLSLIRLAPTVRDGHFYLSCLNEPTLHPHLNRFLGLVPPEDRRKMFFTTNLARPLKEADFEAWAESGLHHINISLDTLDTARFGVLRRFGRFDVFMRNLEALSAAFRRTAHAPKLRYITMAFKSNFDEIATIVRRSREEWIASANEIRYTFNVSHITDEFRTREYLTREDWPRLTDLLQQTGYAVEISYPPEENYEKIEPAQNYYDQPGGKAERILITKPMGLRVRPDGTVLVNGAEDGFRVNINALENPPRFFRALLRQATPRFDGFVGLP